MRPPRSKTPFVWLYCPVITHARDGEQIEFVQNALENKAPSCAIRSRFGVGAISASRPWYAEIA